MKYKLKTEIIGSIINHRLFLERDDLYEEHGNNRELVTSLAVDTQEKATKTALIELGWTPPDSLNKGLICPWCPNHPPIDSCKHNPFVLIQKLNDSKKELYDLKQKLKELTQ